jgi:hypothetical protein
MAVKESPNRIRCRNKVKEARRVIGVDLLPEGDIFWLYPTKKYYW